MQHLAAATQDTSSTVAVFSVLCVASPSPVCYPGEHSGICNPQVIHRSTCNTQSSPFALFTQSDLFEPPDTLHNSKVNISVDDRTLSWVKRNIPRTKCPWVRHWTPRWPWCVHWYASAYDREGALNRLTESLLLERNLDSPLFWLLATPLFGTFLLFSQPRATSLISHD